MTDSTDLEHLALSLHASAGFTLDAPWAPRAVLQYDYASGDRSPDDEADNWFDLLFGARRFELVSTAPSLAATSVRPGCASRCSRIAGWTRSLPYYGDATEPIDPRVPSAHETIAVWGRVDECGALTASSETIALSSEVDGDETTVEVYADCPPGIGVELWTMNGVQHSPSPQPNFMTLLCGFLAQHPRP